MTDRELATALTASAEIEQLAQRQWETACRSALAPNANIPERDAALVVKRHVTALKRSLEQWMAARACRAALQR